MARRDAPHGFEAGHWDPPQPVSAISDVVRERMVGYVAAVVCGHTPERALGCLRAGEWPVDVVELLGRDLWPEELGAHVEVLRCLLDGSLP